MMKRSEVNLPLTVIYLATMFPIYKFYEVESTFRPIPRNSSIYPDIKKNHILNSVHVVELCCQIPLGIRYFWGVIHNPAFVTTGSFAVLGGFTIPIKLFKSNAVQPTYSGNSIQAELQYLLNSKYYL